MPSCKHKVHLKKLRSLGFWFLDFKKYVTKCLWLHLIDMDTENKFWNISNAIYIQWHDNLTDGDKSDSRIEAQIE